MKLPQTTIINHESRKDLGLSMNEYCVLDLIRQVQVDGWCQLTYREIADHLELTGPTVLGIIQRSVANGLALIDEDDRRKKATTNKFDKIAISKEIQDSIMRIK